MKAAVLTGETPTLQIRDVAEPSPGPGEVVMEVAASGICGSDLHLAKVLAGQPDIVFGHEFSGRVVAVGSDVDASLEGKLAAGFPLAGCGRCAACAEGNPARCATAEFVGLQRPGAFAEFVRINARDCFVLPSEVSAQTGALVEPLAVAHHALEKTPRLPGEPLLILGAGPVGVAVALYARLFGASDVVLSDPVPGRRLLAEAVGAVAVDPTGQDVAAAFADLTGHAPRAIVECVGKPGLIQSAAELAAPDAHITVVGACVEPDTFTPTTSLAKELTVQFVLYYRPRDFARTIGHLRSGRLDPAPLITDVIALDELPDRFDALMRPTTECKVLITPEKR